MKKSKVQLNQINIEVNGKLLYEDIGSDLFSIHHVPNVKDTFEVTLDNEKKEVFQVLAKHYVFAQVPSYEGSWDQAVILRCKRLNVALSTTFSSSSLKVGGAV